MNEMYTYGTGISQLSVVVPEDRVVIEDKRFTKITGIKEKRVSREFDTLDMCLKAARKLDLSKVKFIISCTQTPRYLIPFNSNILQSELGLPANTGTMDISTGCTGFILGLATASSMAMTLRGDVLLVIGDTLSRTTGDHDPASRLIFGDAAAACVVSFEKRFGASRFALYSDGNKGKAILMHHDKNPKMYMDGDSVLEFALKEIPELVGWFPVCDNYVFHQSNMMILNNFKQLVSGHFPTSIEMYGNTSGASIPLTMALDKTKGKTLLCGYGSGLSWGVAIMDIDCEYQFNEV